MTNNFKIAVNFTISDWVNLRDSQLLVEIDQQHWDKAVDLFNNRLKHRYLNSIELLQKEDKFKGEGFSIMTILCSLIEFLESTYQGKIYKYCHGGMKIGNNEYCRSKDIFTNFLTKREPFKQVFTKKLAEEFYSNIRCGLLHEAATKNGWRILSESPNNKIINTTEKVIYRNNFKESIVQFIDEYCNKLKSDTTLQENFIRKFDSICNTA